MSGLNTNNVLRQYKGLTEIFRDKKLANLGDSFINLIYSLAKSIVLKSPEGWKVSSTVLSQAMKDAGLRKYAPKRASAHDIGDFAEAIMAYSWLSKKITFEEATDILSKNLEGGVFSDIKKEERTAIIAFTKLFQKLMEKLSLK